MNLNFRQLKPITPIDGKTNSNNTIKLNIDSYKIVCVLFQRLWLAKSSNSFFFLSIFEKIHTNCNLPITVNCQICYRLLHSFTSSFLFIFSLTNKYNLLRIFEEKNGVQIKRPCLGFSKYC